jgi:hypothetical protein
MHVQLADNITQRRDIQLVCVKGIFEDFRQRGSFPIQLQLIGDIQLKYLTDSFTTRHQDKPGIIRIIGQQ